MKLALKLYKQLTADSLYRNSIYLMASTAVMAGLGFFFWIINARLYSTDQVGIATTLISTVSIISSFCLLGFNNGLIRYLPTSERKNEKIDTGFTIVAAVAVLLSIIYIFNLGYISPKLGFIKSNFTYSIIFVLFVVFTSLNSLIESVFVAYRSTQYILIKNLVWSLLKLALPIFLITLGSFGIFTSIGIATVVSFGLSLLFLILKFGYTFKLVINKDVVKRMTSYSLGNYVAGIIGGLPVMLLPIVILNNLGAKFSAFFYMDMMIANMIFIIPQAVSQSLFAEGSYSEAEMGIHLNKSIIIIALILVPIVLITVIFGKYILLVFGKQYSGEGFALLLLLALSAIPIAINSIFGSILRVKHQINKLIWISLLGTILVLGVSYLLMSQGLIGIGWAWILGSVVMSGVYFVAI